jgi:hypothetical protein
MFTVVRIDHTANTERTVKADIPTFTAACFDAAELANAQKQQTPNNPTVEVTGPTQLSVCIGVYKTVSFKVRTVGPAKDFAVGTAVAVPDARHAPTARRYEIAPPCPVVGEVTAYDLRQDRLKVQLAPGLIVVTAD